MRLAIWDCLLPSETAYHLRLLTIWDWLVVTIWDRLVLTIWDCLLPPETAYHRRPPETAYHLISGVPSETGTLTCRLEASLTEHRSTVLRQAHVGHPAGSRARPSWQVRSQALGAGHPFTARRKHRHQLLYLYTVKWVNTILHKRPFIIIL